MAAPDVNPGEIVQVENGPTHELWRSSTGALRLDWNRLGVVAVTVGGHGHADYGAHMIRRWDIAIRGNAKVTWLIDFGDMPTYDSGLRTAMTGWAIKHRASLEPGHVLTRSKLVAMGVAVGNLATGGLLTSHSARSTYDLEVKRLGLPVNPLASR